MMQMIQTKKSDGTPIPHPTTADGRLRVAVENADGSPIAGGTGGGGTPELAQPVGADVALPAGTSTQLHAAASTRWQTDVYNDTDTMVYLNIGAAASASNWVGRVQPQSSTTLTRPQAQGQLTAWCSAAATLRVVTQAVA